MTRGARADATTASEEARRLPLRIALALFAVSLGVGLLLYGPALRGPFVSDDLHYVASNPYIQELSARNVIDILDPAGPVTILVVNWTPVHLLLHAAAWQAFGPDVGGHHVVNVVFHALASVLLVALLARSGLPLPAAMLGGALFLVHPANVEAVAWISQLKSSSALVLALLALLLWPRRPGLGGLALALGLLAKPAAAFALGMAACLDFVRSGRVRWRWIAVWAGVFTLYAAIEFGMRERAGTPDAVLHQTPLVLIRTIFSLAARYLVMAYTSWGLSTFHAPAPATSWGHPWWLASLPLVAVLAIRFVSSLRARREEAAWWLAAAISFVPVSQLFPFLYPMADRYLYFILPGLIGGTLLAVHAAIERVAGADARRARQLAGAGLALGAGLTLFFATRSLERAAIWSAPARILADAAAQYPDGVPAHLVRARRAVQRQDPETAVAELRGATERGYNRLEQLLGDPTLAPLHGDARFRALTQEIAASWIERLAALPHPTQLELWNLAYAHTVRGEEAPAREALERALALGGPVDARVRAELRRMRGPRAAGDPER